MHILTPKCPKICQSGAMRRFCFANLSNLDVKVKNYNRILVRPWYKLIKSMFEFNF